MPTSPFAHIYTYVTYLFGTRPLSVLDIGLGNGKLGFIARDLLDVMLGESYKREDWETRIDGIEIFPDYIQDHQKAIYDNIYIGDAFEVIDTLGSYDMIVLGDVLEHFKKKQALRLFDKCVAHSNKHIVIFIPLGNNWNQPEIYGNPHEKHLSAWQFQELELFSCSHEVFQYAPGPYGAFLIKKNDYIDYRIQKLREPIKKTKVRNSPGIRERYSLCRESISKIDLARYDRYIANAEHRNYFLDTNFKEHYRLIAYLSTFFNNLEIFDIGTNKGYSALALSYKHSNRVISYDLVECRELHNSEELSRIDFFLGDVLKDKRLLKSPLIMLDTNHDGGFENIFYRFLKKNNYKGLLFLDDIHLNRPMEVFWNSITEPKEDLTDLGHWSGSGLVDFLKTEE